MTREFPICRFMVQVLQSQPTLRFEQSAEKCEYELQNGHASHRSYAAKNSRQIQSARLLSKRTGQYPYFLGRVWLYIRQLDLLCCALQVIAGLHIEPELSGGSKIARQTKSRISSN